MNNTLDGKENPFEEMAKVLEAAMVHEKTVMQIMTLAVEYEAKTISAERFADRTCEIIKLSYKKFVQSQ